jgi:predicted PurR-regulated permease PerM
LGNLIDQRAWSNYASAIGRLGEGMALSLLVASGILLVLCWQLVRPFVIPLAWALALAVVAHPLHGWLARQIKKPGLAAGIALFAIAVVLAALVLFVGQTLVSSIAFATQSSQSFFQNGEWREQLTRIPWLGSLLASLEQQANLSGQLQSMAGEVGKRVSEFAAGSAWILVQVLLTFFVLFYLFRDRREALGTLRSLVPLSEKETDRVFTRVADTIHATIFGTLTVAAVQGVLGGLIFWWLGLPAPILWGAVMGLLAIVPVLGAFVVWLPVAIFLAASGQWGKATPSSRSGVAARRGVVQRKRLPKTSFVATVCPSATTQRSRRLPSSNGGFNY